MSWPLYPEAINRATSRRKMAFLNKSGAVLSPGDVVIVDTSDDYAVTTTTTARHTGSVGVVVDAEVAVDAYGRVTILGFAEINVPSSVTRGHFAETHTVAGQATGSATRRSGSFGQFLTGGDTPTVWLWGSTDQDPSAIIGSEITDIPTAETDGDKVLSPDGVGGVEWRAEAAGASGGYNRLGTLLQAGKNATTANAAVTLGAAPTEGNVLVAVCGTSGNGGAGGVSAITQTNVSWSLIASANSGNTYVNVWVGVVSAAAGALVTLTAPQYSWLYVTEWEGLAGTEAGSEASATGTIQTPLWMPTEDCVVFAGWCPSSGGAVPYAAGLVDSGLASNFAGAGHAQASKAGNRGHWQGGNTGVVLICGVK